MKIVSKILTWLLYTFFILLVVAAIALVVEFIFWILNIEIKSPI